LTASEALVPIGPEKYRRHFLIAHTWTSGSCHRTVTAEWKVWLGSRSVSL